MGILEKIKKPSDLSALSFAELNKLASEIRGVIIETVSKNGGHLASNLGVVELTLALHRSFDLSRDRFVFDVGHQCYTHKILTGRLGEFETLRKSGGISGFPKVSESIYDAFGTGHSSTSISAAVGFAVGRDLSGGSHHVGALIGDASLSSGMAFEAMNHLGHNRRRVIIILNDNEMSIASNVGALSVYLEKIRVGKRYNKLKEDVEALLKTIPVFGSNVAKFIERIKGSLKYLVVPGILFEELGIKYIGPVDGHNIEQIVNTFENIKDFPGPTLIHVMTKKGKGFAPAETAPEKYHSAGFFCVESGNSIKPKSLTYTDVFGETLTRLAANNERILAISASMCDGTGLTEFSNKYPARFFDVGICEQHATTFAAGLAMSGYIPVFAVYSTFSQRAIDQWIHDIALQNLHVVMCLDRAGLVGEDGPTHHGAFDISLFRTVPNTIIMAPSNEVELKNAIFNAVTRYCCPVVVRYPKSSVEGIMPAAELFSDDFKYEQIEPGKSRIALSPAAGKQTSAIIVGLGQPLGRCLEAAAILEKEHEVFTEVVDARFARPIDTAVADRAARSGIPVVCVEENSLAGGFGEGMLSAICRAGGRGDRFRALGISDSFVAHGANSTLRESLELDTCSIVKAVLELIKK